MGAVAESYSFDAVGNRTASHLSSTYSYQPFNRLTATAGSTQNFDANGNTVSKSEGSNFWRYSWDHENRLTEAAARKSKVRYRYDALGRRVERYIVGGRERTKFSYDGQDVVLDDDSGVLTKYQNGPGIDNKLQSKTGSDVKYFFTDHLGSTNGLADATGSLTALTAYDSFGNPTNAAFPTRYQFTGREYDQLTGLYHYRNRWYDAKLGRFMSEDPIGFRGGDVNLYGYLRSSPLLSTDPLGLSPWDWKDFVYHYYFGGGRAIDLADIGLLSAFRSSSSVISQVTGFKAKIIAEVKLRAAKECDKNCVIKKEKRQIYFSNSDSTSTNVTSEPGLFAVGRSTFYRNATCFADVDCGTRTARFNCSLGFSIRDRFTDPLDGERIGKPFNLPAAQPYGIIAFWMEGFSGQCKF